MDTNPKFDMWTITPEQVRSGDGLTGPSGLFGTDQSIVAPVSAQPAGDGPDLMDRFMRGAADDQRKHLIDFTTGRRRSPFSLLSRLGRSTAKLLFATEPSPETAAGPDLDTITRIAAEGIEVVGAGTEAEEPKALFFDSPERKIAPNTSPRVRRLARIAAAVQGALHHERGNRKIGLRTKVAMLTGGFAVAATGIFGALALNEQPAEERATIEKIGDVVPATTTLIESTTTTALPPAAPGAQRVQLPAPDGMNNTPVAESIAPAPSLDNTVVMRFVVEPKFGNVFNAIQDGLVGESGRRADKSPEVVALTNELLGNIATQNHMSKQQLNTVVPGQAFEVEMPSGILELQKQVQDRFALAS